MLSANTIIEIARDKLRYYKNLENIEIVSVMIDSKYEKYGITHIDGIVCTYHNLDYLEYVSIYTKVLKWKQ